MHRISFHFHPEASFTSQIPRDAHIYNTIECRLRSSTEPPYLAFFKKKTLYEQKTIMASPETGRPRGPGLLSDGSQAVINRWFTHYNFSFSNPEDIAARLTRLKRQHKRRRPNQRLPGNCD